MPIHRKLSVEEVMSKSRTKTKPSGDRARIREEYKSYIQDLEEGEGGEFELEEGDKRVTIKNRIKAAARDLGRELTFIRSGSDRVIFKVGGAAPSNAGEAAPPEKKPRGRRRKTEEGG